MSPLEPTFSSCLVSLPFSLSPFSLARRRGVGFACGFFWAHRAEPGSEPGAAAGDLHHRAGLGRLVGAGLGLLCAALRVSGRAFVRTLAVAAVVAGGATLFASPLGFVIDAEVACTSPGIRAARGAGLLGERAGKLFIKQQRGGWREDMAAMLVRDPGVLVTLEVHAAAERREQRKPWNRGELVLRDRGAPDASATSPAPSARGARVRDVRSRSLTGVGEKRVGLAARCAPHLFNLHVLHGVPERFRSLLGWTAAFRARNPRRAHVPDDSHLSIVAVSYSELTFLPNRVCSSPEMGPPATTARLAGALLTPVQQRVLGLLYGRSAASRPGSWYRGRPPAARSSGCRGSGLGHDRWEPEVLPSQPELADLRQAARAHSWSNRSQTRAGSAARSNRLPPSVYTRWPK